MIRIECTESFEVNENRASWSLDFTDEPDGRLIDRFMGEYRWLSNFHLSPVTLPHLVSCPFPSVENAFQASKCPLRADEFVYITPFQAKRLGQRVKLREDWEKVKESVMWDCLLSKFEDEDLQEKLLSTGTAFLVEGNTWGDKFWGAELVRNDWPIVEFSGSNKLGVALMLLRERLASAFERRLEISIPTMIPPAARPPAASIVSFYPNGRIKVTPILGESNNA